MYLILILITRLIKRFNANIRIGRSSFLIPMRVGLFSGSRLTIGDKSMVYSSLKTNSDSSAITIGNRCFIGSSLIDCFDSINIHDDVLVSSNCFICDHDGHSTTFDYRKNDVEDLWNNKKDWSQVKKSNIEIESGAWIGRNAVILKGVTIGQESIVAAGSVVTKDVPKFTVVAGNPAKVIKKLK